MSDWQLWQLIDSAFPTGGYAHSMGLEAAWQYGEVRNAEELSSFIDATLQQAAWAVLPFVTSAHSDPDRLRDLDELCDTFTTNHVANRASRLQGRAWRSAVTRIFGSESSDPKAHQAVGQRNGQAKNQTPSTGSLLGKDISFHEGRYGHFGPVFGASTRTLGFPKTTAIRLLLFYQLRGLFAAAVRLNIVGPIEAQRLQHRLGPSVEDLMKACAGLTVDDLAQTAPLLDLWQGGHDRLYSRLFQS